MQSSDGKKQTKITVQDVAAERKVTIGVSLAICIIFAGVIGIDYSNQCQQKLFDPRVSFAAHCATDPMDETYRGYIPHDAVIPAEDGIYLCDDEEEAVFKKLPQKQIR
ncbi:MAG: hypothetical protein KJ645_09600 [Planctomycetes bacterium]|nr:hypothetical protein [Planctomycetota bacterium]